MGMNGVFVALTETGFPPPGSWGIRRSSNSFDMISLDYLVEA